MPQKWLASEWVLRLLAEHLSIARQRFLKYIKDGKGQPGLWDKLNNQIYFGNEQFVARMLVYMKTDTTLDVLPGLQRWNMAKSLQYYGKRYPVKIAMKKAYETGEYTFKEIAVHFGVHYSTVSRAVNGGR